MAVGQQAEQRELERLALPDHGALDFPEDPVAALGEGGGIHS